MDRLQTEKVHKVKGSENRGYAHSWNGFFDLSEISGLGAFCAQIPDPPLQFSLYLLPKVK